jgi:preprotein translocase subunit SecD
MKGNNWAKFAAVIVIFAIITYLVFSGAPAIGIPSIEQMRLGIDIRGGISTILYPDIQDGSKPTEDQLKSARAVIEKRLDNKGIFDRNITIENEQGRIIVDIPYKPGEKDLNPQKAIDELGKTALLTFQEVDENLKDDTGRYKPTGRIILQGEHVEDARVQTNPQTGEVVVGLKLYKEGAEKFAEATGRLVKQRIAILNHPS